MASRHGHFVRHCNICGRDIYGTSISHRNHKENCREKQSRMPEWGKKLGARVKL